MIKAQKLAFYLMPVVLLSLVFVVNYWQPVASMRGVTLGMSKQQVHRILGSTSHSAESSEKYPDMVILYENNRVDYMSGQQLEFKGHSFKDPETAFQWLSRYGENQSPLTRVYKYTNSLRDIEISIGHQHDEIVVSRIHRGPAEVY